MPATKQVLLVGFALVSSLSAWAGPALELGSTLGTNAPALLAEARHEEGPGLLPVDRAFLRAGTNRFAFLIPPGFRLESWSDGRAALVTHDYSRQITFRIVGPPLPDGTELTHDFCSAMILAEHPRATIGMVYPAYADSRAGTAFEIGFAGPAGDPRRGLMAFIPARTGILEFSLVCAAEQFDVAHRQFNTVMMTFRASDEKGQLLVAPLSDKL